MKKLLITAALLIATSAQAKDVYWSAVTDTDGNATTINLTDERSKVCPQDGFWHLATIDGIKAKYLCWTMLRN